MNVFWSFTALLATAVFLNTADAEITAWTTPDISGAASGNGALPVQEDQATGTTITTYVATSGGSVTYSLDPAVSPFALTAAGALSITANLDAETKTSYTLNIVALDDTSAAPTSGTATITVTVSDVNEAPAFGQSSYTQCIADGSAADTTVITVLATDQDTGDVVTHSIVAAGNTNSDFKIDGTTGVIQVNTGKTLSMATTPTYTLVVNAADNDGTSLTGTTTVTVTVSATCNSATAVTFCFLTILMTLIATM